MSKRMMMPQNKREEIIFCAMCVMFMCAIMLSYNMFLTMGFTFAAIQAACMAYPLTCAVCFCLDFFVVCPIVQRIMRKIKDAGKVVETSYGKSSGKYDTTADFLTNIENRNGKFYTDKATIDKIGQVEARGEDFSPLNKRIMSSRASTEGGTSVVYKYSDELGTKYLIHEVTDARGYIIHRDFDAVRISSGQLINKEH